MRWRPTWPCDKIFRDLSLAEIPGYTGKPSPTPCTPHSAVLQIGVCRFVSPQSFFSHETHLISRVSRGMLRIFKFNCPMRELLAFEFVLGFLLNTNSAPVPAVAFHMISRPLSCSIYGQRMKPVATQRGVSASCALVQPSVSQRHDSD